MLGSPLADLYDLTEAGSDYEEGALVDAARTRYQQVVSDLREQILSGGFPPGETLPGQAKLAGDARADSAIVNRALSALRAEGLIRVEHGRRTVVLERSLWVVEFRSADPETAAVDRALSAAAAQQPAVRSTRVSQEEGGRVAALTVESADLAGAVTVAVEVARQALGPLDAMLARKA